MIDATQFKSLLQLFDFFKTEQDCIDHVTGLRWPDGNVVSPFCPGGKVYVCAGNKYKCKETGKYFNVRAGTMFDNTKIELRKWLGGIYLMSAYKKGVSSHQLGHDLDISQNSAWFMLQRLRYAFQGEGYETELSGTVEADETYIGGNQDNRNRKKEGKYTHFVKTDTTRSDNKAVVMGAVERGGSVFTRHIPNAKAKSIIPYIINNVKSGSTIYSDIHYAYAMLPDTFTKDTVNHTIKEYVRGDVHTNTIENYWSVLKWTLEDTYRQVSKKHLQKYLNESAFRYNTRGLAANVRFNLHLCKTEMRLKPIQMAKKETPKDTPAKSTVRTGKTKADNGDPVTLNEINEKVKKMLSLPQVKRG